MERHRSHHPFRQCEGRRRNGSGGCCSDRREVPRDPGRCEYQFGRDRGRGLRREERSQPAGRRNHAPTREPHLQPLVGAAEPALHRPHRAPEQLRRLLVRVALQVAQDHRPAVPLRQSIDLRVDDRAAVVWAVATSDLDPRLGGVPLMPRPAGRSHLRPHGHAGRDAVEPRAERLAHPERAVSAGQDQERGLERVLGIVAVPQDGVTGAAAPSARAERPGPRTRARPRPRRLRTERATGRRSARQRGDVEPRADALQRNFVPLTQHSLSPVRYSVPSNLCIVKASRRPVVPTFCAESRLRICKPIRNGYVSANDRTPGTGGRPPTPGS